jgi:hypothetical protein
MRTRLATALRRAADQLSPPPKMTVRVFVNGTLQPATVSTTCGRLGLW